MDRSNLLSAALALCCVFALGTAAATLDSTLSTDPDDVLDLDWDQLPLGNSEAEDIKDEIESNKGSSQGSTAQASSSPGGEQQSQAESDDDPAGASASVGQSGDGPDDAMGPGNPESLLEKLRALLTLLLAGLLLVAALLLLYRYRERVMAVVWRTLGLAMAIVGLGAGADGSGPSRPKEYDPEHAVDEAWVRLARELAVDPEENRTPKEVASIAKSAGMAPGAINRLTWTFEEVRYGGKPVNDERVSRVRRELGELGIGGRST